MKSLSSLLYVLVLITISFSSCEVIGGIFKAGMWTGLILVAIVVIVIIWIIGRMRR